MDTTLNRVIIIGEPKSGETELLRLAFVRLIGKDNVEVIVPLSYEAEKLIAKNPGLVLFVLDGTESSFLPDGLLNNCKPGITTIRIWDLIDRKVWFPIHVAVPIERFDSTDKPFTALDTLAMGLSGVSGIWEISSKLLASSMEITQALGLLKFYWNTKRTFLFGKPISQLFEFYMKINGSTWPTTREGADGIESPVEPLYVKYSFQTALALASLTVEDMTITTSSGISLEHFADRLIQLKERIGLFIARSILIRTLGHLDRGWSERIAGHDKKHRNKLPIWARADGFPTNLPLIKDCEVLQVSGELYKGFIELLDFEREPDNSIFTSIAIKGVGR